MNDELMEQIDEWHKAEKHQEIIDALEQIPEAERDFETTGFLARAYNNIEEYAKAAELLESVREEGAEDERWNFRMGYAQYFLNNYREALDYFSKARELNPEDEYTLSIIRQCNMHLPLTRRVKEFWNWFVENEEKLSGMMNPKSMEEADAFMEFISKGTNLISEDMHFNIGGDHEFTFSVEGWPDLFIIYPYIISCMPECLKGKWKFFPFNPGKVGSFAYRVHDTDVDMGKIMVKASYDEKRENFNIRYYDKNLCALPEENSDGNFHVILELVLGEGVSFKYVNGIERASGIEEGMIALSGLRQHIEETVKSHGHEFFENPKDVYTGYQLTPKESDELRFDVIVGSTCLSSIVADYYHGSTEIFDHANGFGAQALYIVFQNGAGEDNILNFRHDLEDRITEEILEPGNLGVITGGATGTEYSYIDLFVYNQQVFISTLLPLLDEYPEYSFYLSEFCRQGQLCRLSDSEPWKGESPDGISYSPGDDTFFSQIEEWNEKDEYTKSIRALEAIPEEQQDYRIKMLLVSAYENYAIIGDNDEGTERWKGDRVCTAPQKLDTFGVFFMKYNYEIRLKAVKLVLEGGLSVREAGCHLGCGRSQVHLWVTLFERHGLAGLKLRHGSYSAEFKLSVLKHMHQNHLSLLETAVHFGIPGPFVIRQWERLYQNQGAEGLRRKPQRRRPAMSKSKTKKVKLKTTPHEELLKELEYLRAENAYLKKLQALVEERIVRESGKEPKPSKD